MRWFFWFFFLVFFFLGRYDRPARLIMLSFKRYKAARRLQV